MGFSKPTTDEAPTVVSVSERVFGQGMEVQAFVAFGSVREVSTPMAMVVVMVSVVMIIITGVASVDVARMAHAVFVIAVTVAVSTLAPIVGV